MVIVHLKYNNGILLHLVRATDLSLIAKLFSDEILHLTKSHMWDGGWKFMWLCVCGGSIYIVS